MILAGKPLDPTTLTKRQIGRFWARVGIRSEQECWEWTGPVRPDGYVRVQIGKRKSILAHRIAFAVSNGDLPIGALVCHACDNRRCVNPDHLFLGTPKDNACDRSKKNRNNHPRGVSHPNARLDGWDVLIIRADKRRHREIAAEYGLLRPAITAIKTRRNWKHIPEMPE